MIGTWIFEKFHIRNGEQWRGVAVHASSSVSARKSAEMYLDAKVEGDPILLVGKDDCDDCCFGGKCVWEWRVRGGLVCDIGVRSVWKTTMFEEAIAMISKSFVIPGKW